MSTSPINTSVTAPQTTLTGSSTFAADLQTALTRAVSIASLPIQLLQADQTKLSGQATEFGQFGSLFLALQNSVQSLASGAGNGAQSASVSDSSILQASLSGSALPGTYTVNVLNAGSASSAISNAPTPPVTDPTSQNISTSSSFTLTVGTSTFTIHPTANNLNSLASAINSSGAPVQAIVVNLGTPSASDYRLVLQGTALGNNAIQLNDGTSNLLSSLTTGANASYTVDGQPSGGISTSSPTVTIAPGLSVTLEKAGSATVTVSASLSSV